MSDPLVWIRGLHFAATVWAAGTVCFIVLVAEASLLRRLTAMTWAALALTVLSGAAWFALIAANILDVPVAAIGSDGGLWTVLTETRFGQVAGLRLGLAVALALLMARPGRPGLKLAAAAALAGLIALVGHAGAAPGAMGWLHLVSDIVHILAAAAWLGGLPALAMMLSGATDPRTAVARFSTLGIVSVGALLVSGAINSWQLLSGPNDLLATTYGHVLAVKIALFVAMVAVAAVNHYRLTPRLPAIPATRALRRNSLIETGFGFIVLVLAGALGTMIPGAHVHTNAAPPESEAAFVHIHTEAVMADVTIAREGDKTIATIRLSREDGTSYPARAVKLAMEPGNGGVSALESSALPTPDGTWTVENLNITRAGVWNLRLTIATGPETPVVLDAPIVITQCSNECW